ncbi:hypothetical protein L6R50_15500 [Myxococcota bacterium]|nr:hypothetical protein [Myxococcota bacterium]
MKRVLGLVTASILLAALASPAMAQEEDDGQKVIYKQKTEIDFEDVSVEGELKKPHGQFMVEKRQAAFNPLIKMRADFNPEMFDSVNQVK